MQSFGRFSVFPVVPERIGRLRDLAYNLWWVWNSDARQLYHDLDPDLWRQVNLNPVRLLSVIESKRLETMSRNADYLARYDHVMAAFDSYMGADNTWFRRTYPDLKDFTIAYFSPEFGLAQSLPIYSGGLGILAGDYCKEASDLGLPVVGVGFLYPQGYFIQHINADGVQEAAYEKMDFSEMPVTVATGPDGREVVIHVDLPGRRVYAKVWRIQVGRVPVFLMDTDVDPNQPGDRDLGARLYIGDHALRVAQEVVLGIGGVRALRALGISPNVWHMNEGHSAFLGLERIRELINEAGLTFDEAQQVVAASTVFTTHTPVAAGNEAFGLDLMDTFFSAYWPSLGIDRERFMGLAHLDQPWGATFSMTVLALRLSNHVNGVSQLHGQVSRGMWNGLWPETPVEEVPIGAITNGVHTATWLGHPLADLFQECLGDDWYDRIDDPNLWAEVDKIPDEKLWHVHSRLKHRLVDDVRFRVAAHRARLGEGPKAIADAGLLLDPNALTIGFARRFATYKRATLLFQDMERLLRLMNKPGRPVQFVFAGKAHPADEPGKALIQYIYKLSRTPEFAGKIVFLEGYDMEMAHTLTQGVDIWLNTPMRPREASGTSGMKASLNGIPNFSVLDGWWIEGYNGKNGWAIGQGRQYPDEATQNEADALSLYEILENEIVPAFYERDSNDLPKRYLAYAKESLRSLTWRFTARRMNKDYTTQLYIPAGQAGAHMTKDDYAVAKNLMKWRSQVAAAWPQVKFAVDAPREGQLTVGDKIPVRAYVWLGSLKPDDVAVEAVVWETDGKAQARELAVNRLTRSAQQDGAQVYTGDIVAVEGGNLSYGVRILPVNSDLPNAQALGLVKWA